MNAESVYRSVPQAPSKKSRKTLTTWHVSNNFVSLGKEITSGNSFAECASKPAKENKRRKRFNGTAESAKKT
jgi:hypothetical protein